MPIPTTCGPGPPKLPLPSPSPTKKSSTKSTLMETKTATKPIATPITKTITNFVPAPTTKTFKQPPTTPKMTIEKTAAKEATKTPFVKIPSKTSTAATTTIKSTLATTTTASKASASSSSSLQMPSPLQTTSSSLLPSSSSSLVTIERTTITTTATTKPTTTINTATKTPPIKTDCIKEKVINSSNSIDIIENYENDEFDFNNASALIPTPITTTATTFKSIPIQTTLKPTPAATATLKVVNDAKSKNFAVAFSNASELKFDVKCCDDFSIKNQHAKSNNNNICCLKASKICSKNSTSATATTKTITDAGALKCHDVIASASALVASTITPPTTRISISMTSTISKTTTKNCAPSATTSTAATSTASISIPKWLLMLLMLFSIFGQMPHQVAGEKSKHFYMQSLCKNHFLQQLYRKIDGAVLWSQNERNLDCIITFQTHSVLQRFMLRFDMLQLDCNDHLFVYDGAHAVATPKVDISCRNTKQTVSSILTRTNFVTLKYVTDNWGTDANGFKLVITSVKDPKHTCKDFTCTQREFCIHPDLLCDGVNHCGDNSDELIPNLCQNETASTIFGVDMTWFVLIVVSTLLILSAIAVGISICVCRRQDESNLNQNTAIQLHHTAETNGSSKHLHHYQYSGVVGSGGAGGGGGSVGGVMGGGIVSGGGTLSREHTQLPSHHHHQQHHHHHQQLSTQLPSGNWHHPAGPISGYHRIQHNLSKMSKVRPIWCLANSVN